MDYEKRLSAIHWSVWLFGLLQLLASIAILFAVAAPEAHADGLGDLTCPTLDQDPSVYGMHRMLVRFSRIMVFNQQAAWDTVTGAIHNQCPQYEPLIDSYLTVYGARI